MRRVLMFAVVMLALAQMAWACTGFLTGEQTVKTKSGRYVRLCYYDHLGDPLVVAVPTHAFCKGTISVPHPNEDRDGDGKEDQEDE